MMMHRSEAMVSSIAKNRWFVLCCGASSIGCGGNLTKSIPGCLHLSSFLQPRFHSSNRSNKTIKRTRSHPVQVTFGQPNTPRCMVWACMKPVGTGTPSRLTVEGATNHPLIDHQLQANRRRPIQLQSLVPGTRTHALHQERLLHHGWPSNWPPYYRF